ncbi:MAG: serine/threonine-protein kinase [Bradymonadaceae bacterium]
METRPSTSPDSTLPSVESLPPGTVLNDRYRIERRIGLGGYGEVLAAQDLETGLPVAIKILHIEATQNDPRAAARMRQEAGILMAIDHPNIVRVLSIEASDHGEFLVMERLNGETLSVRLKKNGALESDLVLRTTRQLLSALELAHDQHILHRDLKPDNILLCHAPLSETGEIAKLVDFGIAKTQAPLDEKNSDDEVTIVKTRIGNFVGTARYSSPEQLVGDPVGPGADLFCLGLVIAEMLTNTPRVGSDNYGDAMAQLVFPKPLDLSDCPKEWQFWLQKMLEKSPTYRFQSAREALESLAEEFGPAPIVGSGTGETTSPIKIEVGPYDFSQEDAKTGKWAHLDLDYDALPREPKTPPALAQTGPRAEELPVLKRPRRTEFSWPWFFAISAVSCLFLLFLLLLVRYLVA